MIRTDIHVEELFQKTDEKNVAVNMLLKSEQEVEAKRGKWLELQKEHKDLTITELRKFSYSTYRLLLKYNKDWMYKNSPRKKRKGNNHRIDWKKRDEEIVKLCKVAVEEILVSEDKPQRVSIALIGRKFGKKYLLSKCLERLEVTKKSLEESGETVEQFQEGRIKWVKDKYPEIAEW